LAGESFVLSQAFYIGGIVGQPQPKVIVTEGARIDLCDFLDATRIYKNGTSTPTAPRVWEAGYDLEGDDDDPRLLQECQRRAATPRNTTASAQDRAASASTT